MIKTLADYQRSLTPFEAVNDGQILPEIFVVARLDAHRFGQQWKDSQPDYPFGELIVDGLIHSAQSLMRSGLRIDYSYIHGDEISVLLERSETNNPRRRSRLISYLVSIAALEFREATGYPAVFHARLSELPTTSHVVDYFMWQRKVSLRNYLSMAISRNLTAQGASATEIDQKISKLTEDERITYAGKLGINLRELAAYNTRGAGAWWEADDKLRWTKELPESDEAYASFVRDQINLPNESSPAPPKKPGPLKLKLR